VDDVDDAIERALADRFLATDARTAGWRADADFELDVAEFEAAIAEAAAPRREAEERAALGRVARRIGYCRARTATVYKAAHGRGLTCATGRRRVRRTCSIHR
jgi:hypothetical protein